MKASSIRKLALAHDAPTLEQAADDLIEEREPAIEIEGEDDGERLTHINLALRIRRRVDDGIDAKTAFRTVLADVRALLTND